MPSQRWTWTSWRESGQLSGRGEHANPEKCGCCRSHCPPSQISSCFQTRADFSRSKFRTLLQALTGKHLGVAGESTHNG